MPCPKLVAVKAEEWQRRAFKVMGQAKPQLDVVRELFEEGRELGYEELAQGVVRFFSRQGRGVAWRGRCCCVFSLLFFSIFFSGVLLVLFVI